MTEDGFALIASLIRARLRRRQVPADGQAAAQSKDDEENRSRNGLDAETGAARRDETGGPPTGRG